MKHFIPNSLSPKAFSWLGLLLFWLAVLPTASAQTTLSAGDVLFLGYNASDDQVNGANSNEKFSFLLLKDVTAGTRIYFTDFGWLTGGGFQKRWELGPQNGGSGTGSKDDGIVSWTASAPVAAGTQIVIRPKYNTGASIGTFTGVETVAGQSYFMNLSDIAGDQLFAYQASSARAANPTLLAGLMILEPWAATLTNDQYTPSKSTLPAALTAGGVNAALNIYSPVFELSFRALSIYNCSTNLGFPRTLRNAVNAMSTWTIPNEGTACAGYLYQPNPGQECYQPGIPAGYDLPIACTFTVLQVRIVQHPVSRTVCSYEQASFSVAAENAQTYRWQGSSDGVTWVNLTNGAVYGDVTTTTLKVLNPAGLNGMRYRALAEEPIEPSSVPSNAATLTVKNPPQNLTFAASGPITCNNTSVTLTASSSTQNTTFAFSGPSGPISTSAGATSVSVSATGVYTVRATVNNCTSSTTVTVVEDKTPPQSPTLVVSGPLTCNTASVTLTAGTSSPGTLTYRFYDADNQLITSSGNTASVNKAGNYSVSITGGNGCPSVASVTVVEDKALPQSPTLVASGPLTCNTASVTLTAGTGSAGTFTYIFYDEANQPIPSSGNTATVSQAGGYSVKITGGNGCSITASRTVVEDKTLPQTPMLLTSGTLNCNTASVTLTASTSSSGTFTYNFYNADNQLISSNVNRATVSQAGTYSVKITGENGCQATASVTVTADPLPAAPNLSSQTVNQGDPAVVLSPTNCSGTIQWMGPGGMSGVGPITVSTSVAGEFEYSVVCVVNGCGSQPTVVTVTVVASSPTETIWQGTVSADWNLAANWSAGVPTAAMDAEIPSGLTRYPALSMGSAQAKNLSIAQGAALAISGGTLTLSGGLSNSGAITHTGGTVAFTGSTAQTLSGSATTFMDLTVGPKGLSLSNPVGVKGVLTLNGNLTTAGNALTLLSDASGTGMVVNVGGVVVGEATVQRYIAADNTGRGYRHYSSPVMSTTVADLATPGFTPIVNPAYNTLPAPPMSSFTAATYPNVFTYDESRLTSTFPGFDVGWRSPESLSSTLVPGRGYTALVPATAKVDLVGMLNSGNVSVALSRGPVEGSGWHLLGNPYPSPLDWDGLTLPAGVAEAVYVYRPTGAGTGFYASYVNGLGTFSFNGTLPVMQGFFVRATAPATFRFTDAARMATQTTTPFKRTGPETRPLVELRLTAPDGKQDEALVYLEEGATNSIDREYDAFKVLGNLGGQPTLYSLVGAEKLSINGLAPLTGGQTAVALGAEASQAGTHTLRAERLLNLNSGVEVLLEDKATGAVQDLRAQPSYTFTPSNQGQGRFVLHIGKAAVLGLSPLAADAQLLVFPNPTSSGSLTVSLSRATAKTVGLTLFNSLGQQLLSATLESKGGKAEGQLDTSRLSAGVYHLQVTDGQGTAVRKVVVR